MKPIRILLAAAALLLMPLLPASAGEATVVYLVRHAEKAGPSGDVPLTDAGRARADLLARMLSEIHLTGVHSTDYQRTRDTAAPTAEAQKLTVALYDPEAPKDLVAQIETAGGAHLVVGHSNTVPDLVGALNGDGGKPIADDEYDRLYLVILPRDGKPVTQLLRYGAAEK